VDIKKLIPARDTVLVKLPPFTDKLLREDEALSFSTLNQIKYDPSFGEVVAISPTINNLCKIGNIQLKKLPNANVEIGDTVYFEKQHWQTAKDAAFDCEAERDKGIYFEQETYAIIQDNVCYMVLPYKFLYMVKRDGNFTMLNGYTLCEAIKKKINPSIQDEVGQTQHIDFNEKWDNFELKIADLREVDYEYNKVKVVQSSTDSWEQRGDIVFTEPICDIPLVESVNQQDKEDFFIIESDNIICKLMEEKYIAAPNRIIIELIKPEISEDTLIVIDSEFATSQRGKVISAGKNAECKDGDVIIFPRNAGKKNRLPVLEGSSVQYEVIGKDDYFCIVSNK